MSVWIIVCNRVVLAIHKKICASTLRGVKQTIRIDEPTPCGVIIPALEIIQPGLYGAYLAARAKLAGKKMEITGSKSDYFYRPGRGVTSPG